jgi:(2R)-3-sulfolactate dehydrogenase (NADP+)
LTAGAFGWEASSFFDADGKAPDMGHLFLALDPGPTSGGAFSARMAALAAAVASDPAVRLPGSRRLVLRDQAAREGIRIDAALHAEIVTLSGKAG